MLCICFLNPQCRFISPFCYVQPLKASPLLLATILYSYMLLLVLWFAYIASVSSSKLILFQAIVLETLSFEIQKSLYIVSCFFGLEDYLT